MSSTTQQPKALRLAYKYEVEGFLNDHRYAKDHWCTEAVAELHFKPTASWRAIYATTLCVAK